MKYAFASSNAFILIISLGVSGLALTTLLDPDLLPQSVLDHFPEVLPATVAVCSLGGTGVILTLLNWIVLWTRNKRFIKCMRGCIFVSVTLDFSMAAVCMYLWYRARKWVITNTLCKVCAGDVNRTFLLLLPATCGLIICSVPKVACFVMMYSLCEESSDLEYSVPTLTYRCNYVTSSDSLDMRRSYIMSSDSLDAGLSSRQNLLPKRISIQGPQPICSPSAKNHLITRAAKNAVQADPKFMWLRQGSKRSFSPISPEYIEELRMKSLDHRLTGSSLPKLPTSSSMDAAGDISGQSTSVAKEQEDVSRSLPNIVMSSQPLSEDDVKELATGLKPLKGILKNESFKEDLGSDKLLDNSVSTHIGSNTSTDKLLGNTSNIQVSQSLYV